jgi:Zn-dependent M28 family amino/carboxypeptidase
MAARVGGIVVSATLWLMALAVAAAQWSGAPLESWWAPISVFGVVGGLPVATSVVADRSPGALDNASGVATVLMAAALLERSVNVGVLLTSAEELGLAGARAWSAAHPAALAINCDGVDDAGRLTCMYTGRRPSRVVAALERGARVRGVSLSVRRLIPGLLVDAVALRDAGWDCATVSRGTWRTLARIHSAGDRADRLTGAGVAEAAMVVSDAVGLIVRDGPIFRAATGGVPENPSSS